MKYFLTCLALGIAVAAGAQMTSPWNPDEDGNQSIGSPDLLSFLTVYGEDFVPEPVQIDSLDLYTFLVDLQSQIESLQNEVDSLNTLLNSNQSSGLSKYLLRLEYDINESLIPENTVFVDAPGFLTAGASIVSQVAGGGNLNSKVLLNFSDENNPPSSILGYGWNPATGDYTVIHYDRDQKQMQYRVGLEAFVQGSASDGGSGSEEQWSGTQMSEAGSFNLELWVDQQALSYGNAIAAVPMLGAQPVYPHAYLIIQF